MPCYSMHRGCIRTYHQVSPDPHAFVGIPSVLPSYRLSSEAMVQWNDTVRRLDDMARCNYQRNDKIEGGSREHHAKRRRKKNRKHPTYNYSCRGPNLSTHTCEVEDKSWSHHHLPSSPPSFQCNTSRQGCSVRWCSWHRIHRSPPDMTDGRSVSDPAQLWFWWAHQGPLVRSRWGPRDKWIGTRNE